MGWLSFASDVGKSVVDAGLGYFSAKQQNDMAQTNARDAERFTAGQSAQQMAFQERMSNTSHQRQVADLRAAGLNPLLSLNSGSSTPGGAMGSGVNAPVVPEVGAAVGSAREGMKLRADLNLLREHTRDAKSKASLSELEFAYARRDPGAYFTAKQGGVNTLFGRTMGSISSSAKSVKPNWRSLMDMIDVAPDHRYITDTEMRRRGAERRRRVREERHRSGPRFNRRHLN